LIFSFEEFILMCQYSISCTCNTAFLEGFMYEIECRNFRTATVLQWFCGSTMAFSDERN
jgi:hypothetical protein